MTSNAAPRPRLRFETTECTRCGGSGSYGPVQVEGGRCFTCLGKGIMLTRRGRLAKSFLDENLETMNKALEDIVPGERVWLELGMSNVYRWMTVTESHADNLNPGRWTVRAEHKGKVYGLGGATRAMAETPGSGFTKPTSLRVWDQELYDRAVGATSLMPGASFEAPVKDAEEGVQAPKKEAVAGTKRATGSHKDCDHESTPKARAACRKARQA